MIAKITTATVAAHRFKVILANVVKNYNSSDHRMIETTPDKAHKDPSANKQVFLKSSFFSRFAIGDAVRVMLPKRTFAKGSEPKWSSETYEPIGSEGYRLRLKGLPGLRHYSEVKLVKAPQSIRKTPKRAARPPR
jgi:hypothetical protein